MERKAQSIGSQPRGGSGTRRTFNIAAINEVVRSW